MAAALLQHLNTQRVRLPSAVLSARPTCSRTAVSVHDDVDIFALMVDRVSRRSIRVIAADRRWCSEAVAWSEVFIVHDRVLRLGTLLLVERKGRYILPVWHVAMMIVARGAAHIVRVADLSLIHI